MSIVILLTIKDTRFEYPFLLYNDRTKKIHLALAPLFGY